MIKIDAIGQLKASGRQQLEILIWQSPPKILKQFLNHFVSYPYMERIIEKGDVSSSILTSGGKQIDLLIQPPEAFGSLLQHFTGSKNHNVHLREFALKKGSFFIRIWN